MKHYSPEEFAATMRSESKNVRWTKKDLSVNMTDLEPHEQALLREALKEISTFSGITFREVSKGADLTYYNDGTNPNASWSYSGSRIKSATIKLPSQFLKDEDGVGSYGFRSYIHETLHALGLGHPQKYKEMGGFETGKIANDSWQMSVMSYFSQDENTQVHASWAAPITPMMADYMAVRSAYGKVDIRTGHTVYGVGSTAGGTLDKAVSLGAKVAFLIADHGGHDLVDFSSVKASQRIDLRPGTFSDVMGGMGNMGIAPDTLIEAARGGEGSDALVGNHLDNTLDGRGGADRMSGGKGNDIYIQTAGDVIIKFLNQGIDTVRATADYVMGEHIENAQALGKGNLRLTGNSLNNRLEGNDGNNVLDGGLGKDTLIGGKGNDTYHITRGDTISEGKNGGIDTVVVGHTWTVLTHLENATLSGKGNWNLTGTGADNVLTGNDGINRLEGLNGHDRLEGRGGNDTLNGGGGRDRLDGGAGNDALKGGTGNDCFVFNGGRDRILDFADNVDEIAFARTLGLRDAAQVMSCGRQAGADVVFSFGEHSLTVKDVRLDSLQDDIFLL